MDAGAFPEIAMEGPGIRGNGSPTQSGERRRTVQRVLLACGPLAILLYLAADVLGGLRYEGYRFTEQAVSELMATGAPSEGLVDPLFLAYGVFMLAFGVGVVREAAGRNRALQAAGVLLAACAAIGLTGPTLFEMAPRGTGAPGQDVPHIVLTAVLVVLLLAAFVAGAFALGRRFRRYSLATLATVLVFGALTAPYAARLAAGAPTPGFGIIERVTIYAALLWVGVLAVALLRRPVGRAGGTGGTARVAVPAAVRPPVAGTVAPGFEEVRAVFARNFTERGEIGAAVAAYWRGEKVVDLWGGRRTPDGDAPWAEDTMVVVMSTTKGLAAMTLAMANARGWLDYDAPVARYWPAFAQHGKETVTVRQLLAHEAGLVLLDAPLTVAQLHDLDGVAHLLARQKPAWPPGTRHGYHAMTIGLYMQELIRRTDPAHRTLGRFFHEEIAVPLGLDFYIGLPPDIPAARLARVQPLSRWGALRALRDTPPVLIKKVLQPRSLLRRSLAFPADLDYNDRRSLAIELPAGNGVGTARAIARAYAAFAEGGAALGLTPATFAQLTAVPEVARPEDEVLGIPAYYALGFVRPGPDLWFGSSPRAFGTPGAGGSFGFADPDAHLGYAYVMNRLGFWLVDDPREKALREAVYRAIARRTEGTGRPAAPTPPRPRRPRMPA